MHLRMLRFLLSIPSPKISLKDYAKQRALRLLGDRYVQKSKYQLFHGVFLLNLFGQITFDLRPKRAEVAQSTLLLVSGRIQAQDKLGKGHSGPMIKLILKHASSQCSSSLVERLHSAVIFV